MDIKQLLITGNLAILSVPVVAADNNWFVRPYMGLSQMSDLTSNFTNIDGLSGEANIDLDSGFTAGTGVAYRYGENIALEFGWEYRSNDSEVILNNTSEFDDGNYASNIFYFNLHYYFDKIGNWHPYAGGGVLWAQEIDIDLERNGDELSYSGDGEVGYQAFAGINYRLGESWTLQTELRYGSITGIDLAGEDNQGDFESLEYKTATLQVGLVFEF